MHVTHFQTYLNWYLYGWVGGQCYTCPSHSYSSSSVSGLFRTLTYWPLYLMTFVTCDTGCHGVYYKHVAIQHPSYSLYKCSYPVCHEIYYNSNNSPFEAVHTRQTYLVSNSKWNHAMLQSAAWRIFSIDRS